MASFIAMLCLAQLPGKTIKTVPAQVGTPAVIVKPGTFQTKTTLETTTKSSKDNIQFAKDLVANPIEDLGAEFSPGHIMKTNQILRYKIPGTTDKYCTLKLNFWDVELFDNNNKLIWSTNMHSNQVDNLIMQPDGNLAVRDNANNVLWSTNIINANKGKLYITSDQLIIKDSTQKDSYYWSSIFGKKSWATKSKGASLCSNQFLKLRFDTTEILVNPEQPYSFSFSSNIFSLPEDNGSFKMHPVLELYNTITHKSLWRQEVDAKENAVAYMKADGNFAVYPDIDHLNTPIWESNTSGFKGACLIIPVGNEMFAIHDKEGATKWNPWLGVSLFNMATTSIIIKTGDDDKKQPGYVEAAMFTGKNLNASDPYQIVGGFSNFGFSALHNINLPGYSKYNNTVYEANSINKIKMDIDIAFSDRYKFFLDPNRKFDQSLKSFELNGGRLQIFFDNSNSGNQFDFGRDHWTVDNIELTIIFNDQFRNEISKVIKFSNIDPSKPLTKLGDEVIAGADPFGIVCIFDNKFRAIGYKTIGYKNERKEYDLTDYSY